MKFFLFCFVWICLVSKGDGACTFPVDMIDTWQTSSLGILNFTSTSQVIISNVLSAGDVTFDCHIQEGTKYVLLSTESVQTVFNQQLSASTCFDFSQVTTSVKYLYFHATQKSGTSPYQRYKNPPTSSTGTVSVSSTCDESSPSAGTYDVMIKSDSTSSAAIRCPDEILGRYMYTIAGQCSSSSLDVCTDKQRLTFDYSLCADKVAYSTGGDLSCVYTSTDSGSTFLTLYNNDATTDESATYRYTCLELAINSTNDIVQATQHPQHCISTQTTTTVASPGKVLELTANFTCVNDPTTPSPTDEPSQEEPQVGSASVAAGVSVAVVAIIVLVVLLLFFLVFRKGAPYPITGKSKCSGSKACNGILYCLSCQCCCPKRGRKIQPDEESVITTEEIGVSAKDDAREQITGNGREVDVIPAPAPPPPNKSIDEITADIKPKTLTPISPPKSQNSIDDPEIKLPPKLPPIESPRGPTAEESENKVAEEPKVTTPRAPTPQETAQETKQEASTEAVKETETVTDVSEAPASSDSTAEA